MKISRMTIAAGTGALALLAAGVGGGDYAAAQQSQLPSGTIANLGQQLAAGYTLKSPFETDLPDHLWIHADDKSVVFLHFDKPVAEATRVLYVGYGIRGRWCVEDQQRAEAIAGKGFTHFHRTAKVATPDAGHGGAKAGEPGYWLKHVAVGPAFDMPWGKVTPGAVDQKFMPTAAPKCGS